MALDKNFTQHTFPSSRLNNNPRQFSFSRQLSRSNSASLMKPIRQSINRTPFQLLLSPMEKRHFERYDDGDIMGSILPNAILFQERADEIPFDLSQLSLESYRRREYHSTVDENSSSISDTPNDSIDDDSDSPEEMEEEDTPESTKQQHHGLEGHRNGKVITYHQQYVIYYKHEAVCVFRSNYEVHAHGTSGQSLNVTWRHGCGELQTRILHKGRTSTGQGWNAQEQRTYRVSDILEASAERYANKQQQQQDPCCMQGQHQRSASNDEPQDEILVPHEYEPLVDDVDEEPLKNAQ